MGLYAMLTPDYKLDFDTGIIYFNGNVEISLKNTEKNLLKALARNPGQSFSTKELKILLDKERTPIGDIAGTMTHIRNAFRNSPLESILRPYGYQYNGGRIIDSEDTSFSHIISYEDIGTNSNNHSKLVTIKEEIARKDKILLIAIEAEADVSMYLSCINEVLRDADSSSDVDFTAYGIHVSEKTEREFIKVFGVSILNMADYYICIFNRIIQKTTCSKINEWRKNYAPLSFFFCERDLYSSNMFSSSSTDIEIKNLKSRYNDPRRLNEYTSCDTFYSDDIRTFFYKRLRELNIQKTRKQLQKKRQKKNITSDRADLKFRPTYDSDIVSRINDDEMLVERLGKHRSRVSKSVLCKIFSEEHSEEVWNKMCEMIPFDNESVYIREALECLVDYQQFRHPTYLPLAKSLSEKNQNEYALFLDYLKRVSYDECLSLYNKGYGDENNVNIKRFHKMLNDECRYNPTVEGEGDNHNHPSNGWSALAP